MRPLQRWRKVGVMHAELSKYIEVAQKWSLQHTPVSAQAAACLILQLCDEVARLQATDVEREAIEEGIRQLVESDCIATADALAAIATLRGFLERTCRPARK